MLAAPLEWAAQPAHLTLHCVEGGSRRDLPSISAQQADACLEQGGGQVVCRHKAQGVLTQQHRLSGGEEREGLLHKRLGCGDGLLTQRMAAEEGTIGG